MMERSIYGGLTLFCAGYLASALALPFGTLQKPGLGFMPTLIGIAGVLFAVICFAGVIMKPSAELERPDVRMLGRIAFYVAALVAYVLAMPFAGFAASTFVATFVMLKVAGMRGYILPLVLAAGCALALRLAFQTLLSIPLP